MFIWASNFNQDISSWDISSATNPWSFSNMFDGATAMLANQGVTATPDHSYFVGPPATNDGYASFSITGTATVGNTL